MIEELGYFNSPWSDEIQDFVTEKMAKVTYALESIQKQTIQDEEIKVKNTVIETVETETEETETETDNAETDTETETEEPKNEFQFIIDKIKGNTDNTVIENNIKKLENNVICKFCPNKINCFAFVKNNYIVVCFNLV